MPLISKYEDYQVDNVYLSLLKVRRAFTTGTLDRTQMSDLVDAGDGTGTNPAAAATRASLRNRLNLIESQINRIVGFTMTTFPCPT